MVQHLINICASLSFCLAIAYYLVGIETSQTCYYSYAYKDAAYTMRDSQDYAVSMRFSITLSLLLLFHLVDSLRSVFYILFLKSLGVDSQGNVLNENNMYVMSEDDDDYYDDEKKELFHRIDDTPNLSRLS